MGITDKIADQLEGVATEVYKDAVGPAIKPVGTMLSYLPRTIRLWCQGWEKWIINGEKSLEFTATALKDKLAMIPEEKLCEPEPYVAIPAIQQLSYCYDNEALREMYANLLASSMNIDKKWKVHPAYVDIIKQLTPDEAKFISKLPPNITISHPLIDVTYKKNQEINGYQTIITNFTNVGLDHIEGKGYICTIIENLERLKIIEIPALQSLTNENIYDDLKNHPILTNSIDKTIKEYFIVDYSHKIFRVTNFGVGLINVCC